MATLLEGATLLFLLILLPVRDSDAGCEPRCYPPSEGSTVPLLNEEAAFLHGRCHAACVERETTGGSVGSSQCDILQNVVECRRGCITKAMNPALSTRNCRDECVDSCLTVCNGSDVCTYDGTSCAMRCRNPPCARGCRVYNSLMQLPQNPVAPPMPVNPPNLTRTQTEEREYDAGVLDIGYPAYKESVNYTNVSAFVIKVEILNNNGTYYIVQPSLRDPLDLGFFACEDVAVSFAVVNSYTASNYSPTTEICVHGEMRFPSQLRQGSIGVEWIREDFRPGFFGHALVNITWERPENYEYLSHYLLFVRSTRGGNCGGVGESYRYIVDKEAVSYVLMANSNSTPPGFISGQMKRNGCQYNIALQSRPTREPNAANTLVNVPGVTEPPAPEIDFRCRQITNKTTGIITVIAGWRLLASPSELEYVMEGIDGYEIKLYLVSSPETINPPHDVLKKLEYFDKTVSGFAVELPLKNTSVDVGHDGFVLQFRIVERSDLFWRAVPGRQDCLFNATPVPPHPISAENITIIHFGLFGTRLLLNVSWNPPENTFGGVNASQISIAEEPQPQPQNDDSVLTAQPFTKLISGADTVAVIETDMFFVSEETQELFLQIRSRNMFRVWSNWSDPVLLIRNPTNMTTTTTGRTMTEERLPVYAYIAIAGGCIFIVLLILFGIAMVIVCRKCRETREIKQWRKQHGSSIPDSIFRGPKGLLVQTSIWSPVVIPYKNKLKTDDWEIPSDNVIIEEELGEGCFGMVYKGVVKGPIPNSRTMTTSICKLVAIKFLKSNASGDERKDFLNEIDMMKRIANGNNAHVVSLVGCITIKEPLCLFTEYLKHGNLLSYLQTIRELITQKKQQKQLDTGNGPQPYLDLNSKEEQPPAEEGSPEVESTPTIVITPETDSPYADLGEIEPINLLFFAYQVASGMEYLSSLNVVHRDLACRNILVGAEKKLKISDFGLSRSVEGDDVYVKLNQGKLPWKWMAIESIINREFTTASDVWAYGVTLWEIATLGGFPYPSIPNTELLEHLRGGHRLECPENCTTEIYEIMLDCWQENPASRPTFTQLKAKLDSMLLESKEYIQFNSIDAEQPYYSRLNNEEEENGTANDDQASSSASMAELDPEVSNGYDYLDPVEGGSGIPKHPLPRPFSSVNPYVKTPTKLSREHVHQFDIEQANSERLQQLQAAVEKASLDDI